MPELKDQSIELIRLAADLVPMLRERAERADHERRLDDDAIQAMIDARLFRVWTPKRYGGYQASLATHLAMTTELARGVRSDGLDHGNDDHDFLDGLSIAGAGAGRDFWRGS